MGKKTETVEKYTYYIDRYHWVVAVLPTSELDSGEKSLDHGGYSTFLGAKRALLRELRREIGIYATWMEHTQEKLARVLAQKETSGQRR